jgi:predicted DNA-binding transcriptional regulator AlpA
MPSDTAAVRLLPADPATSVEDLRYRPAPPPPTAEPLLVPAAIAARLCGISEASWFRLKAAGKTPAPVKLGGRVLYRIEELRLWVSWGCPPRKEFDARRGAANSSSRPR